MLTSCHNNQNPVTLTIRSHKNKTYLVVMLPTVGRGGGGREIIASPQTPAP